MSIIRTAIAGGLVIAGLACASPSDATPVVFDFSGTLTQVSTDPDSPFAGPVGFGTNFLGAYIFESSTPDAIAGTGSGSYTSPGGAPYGLSVTIGGSDTLAATDFLNIGVLNGATDFYTVLACGVDSSCPNLLIELTFQDLAGLLLSSDALPLATLALGSTFGTFGLRGSINGSDVELQGTITSLTCVSGCIASPDPNPPAVPEPTTLVLCATGLAGTLWTRLRRSRTRTMHGAALVAAGLSIVIASTSTAFAADGLVLIDQNRALAGNVTPGDAPGFPVTITVPGSYKLSSNLVVPAGTDGITVTVSDVTIDLNGFGLFGAEEGSHIGIVAPDGPDRFNVAVRNGTILGFQTGVRLRDIVRADVRDLRIRGVAFGGSAILTDDFAIVTGNNVTGGGISISVGFQSIVSGNIVTEGPSTGIAAGCPSTIVGNTIQVQFIPIFRSFHGGNNNDCIQVNNSILVGVF